MQLSLFENIKTPSIVPPLRYTGGKRVIAREVMMLMPDNIKSIFSPFMGGGGLELQVAASGKDLYAYDYSRFVTDFWKGFLKDPKKVCLEAYEFYIELNKIDDLDVVKPEVNRLSLEREVFNIEDICKRSAIIWVLNGMVRDGRPGGTFCNNRTEKGANNGKYWGMRRPLFFLNERFMEWCNPYVKEIERLDWRVSMKKHPHKFMYADPPYVGKDRMYDRDNEKFAHEDFAKEVKSRNSYWILSYGEHEMIRDLYADYKILEPKWTKHALAPENPRKDKVDGDELLILNI